jgi:hypothetical protein
MQTSKLEAPNRSWTAHELRALPREERDAILRAAAALAEADYRTDAELTAFDAFGEGDLHGDASDTRHQPR